MSKEFAFAIKSICFDEDYRPSDNTRITTNFANLARGTSRQENLRNTLRMIDNRFNALAHWDNPKGDRYAVNLEIISVEMSIPGASSGNALPLIEILKTSIVDKKTNERIEGIVGNNFSSYVRDYDFSVLLLEHTKNQPVFSAPENFGDLHGKLFKCFVNSSTYKQHFSKPPVICLSVSSSKTYHRTENQHPVLGVEYQQDEYSLTDEYFKKMGMKVRFHAAEQRRAFGFLFFRRFAERLHQSGADQHHQHDGYLPEDIPARDLQRELRGRKILSAQFEASGLFLDPDCLRSRGA